MKAEMEVPTKQFAPISDTFAGMVMLSRDEQLANMKPGREDALVLRVTFLSAVQLLKVDPPN